jgi:hypothetical protein
MTSDVPSLFDADPALSRISDLPVVQAATPEPVRLGGQRARVLAAVEALERAGRDGATVDDIVVWLDTGSVRPPQRNVIARRCGDLAGFGLLRRDGRRAGGYGVDVTIWRTVKVA